MNRSTRYSPEVRERAVRLVFEHQGEHESQWAAIGSIAGKIGCTPETLRKWVRQAERDQGKRGGPSSSDRERLKELERENRELKRANEILRKASAYFAQAAHLPGFCSQRLRSTRPITKVIYQPSSHCPKLASANVASQPVFQAFMREKYRLHGYKRCHAQDELFQHDGHAEAHTMHLDLNVLRGFISDVKTQEHILLEFGNLINDTRGRVIDAVNDGELDVVRSACHALKSSSRSVGAIELGRLSEQLEAIGAGRAPGPIEPALACFLDQCSAVEHELVERIDELG